MEKSAKATNVPILKLKALRAEKMMTHSDMADLLCISSATYSRKENGKGSFNADEISRIMKFFNVTFEDIFST